MQSESKSALAEVRNDVVHSFVAAGTVAAPYVRRVLADRRTILCLVNTVAMEAGQEVFIHLLDALGDCEKTPTGKRQRQRSGDAVPEPGCSELHQ